uniref:bile salt sulfotransferase-like n=1 Tax=Ciona intestinalis TaxID=7719 RepID=UPI000EF4536F|nr:bile salt sulfotransferase-like [Ciona intestinalis]|eukprot:XP_026691622.1 bile salt sulfotransferase-like [Ciona intestinalis]
MEWVEESYRRSFKEISDFGKDVPDIQPLIDYFVESLTQPKLTEWKGYKVYGFGFNADTIKWVYDNWTPWQDDVIVASFPKTALKFEFLDKLPWDRKVLSTHVPAALFNFEKIRNAGAKVIYTIRNPKDQLVSWHKMMVNFPINREGTNLKDHYPLEWGKFFDVAISGKQQMTNKEGEYYMEHLLSWYPHRNDENVLFVVFEDLKKDPLKEIRRIAKFLDVKISEDDLLNVTESSSFASMKKEYHWTEKVKFFRKGEVGDWKNHFTVAQSEKVDALVKQKLAGTDIKFTYEL